VSKLVLDGVSKSFGSFRAVDSFSLQLAEGEFVSLLGPSGCGKTTTLRMIAGFIDPTEGRIEMDGRVLSSPAGATPPEKRRMSMIFQSYAVWPNMTVGENVAFGLKVRKLPREDVERRVDKILEVVHLRPLKERYPAELSGGQQQRVALARAIVIQPEVLLLDEPLSNLDANLREEMRFEIRRLHDEFRITTVYVTHDQGEAMVTSDRIVVMNQGRIEQVDDPFTLYTRPKTRFVAGFIGRTNFIPGRLAPELGDAAALYSVRPQDIALHALPPQANGGILLQGRIVERAYLGERWEYGVLPAAAEEKIRVTALPHEIFQADQAVWIELDPARAVRLPPET
jgi:ABC-type Fe3+/spermidine/putrescine transport system ATPase subunit